MAELTGITLLDLEDVRDWADRGRQAGTGEADLVRAIVAEEVDRYLDDASAHEVAPILGALHDRAEHVRRAELARFDRKLAQLDEGQREAVEALTRGSSPSSCASRPCGSKRTRGPRVASATPARCATSSTCREPLAARDPR